MKTILLALGLLTAQAAAVPILSGGVTGVAGVPVPLGGGVFTQTVTRVSLLNPANNRLAIESAAGLLPNTLPVNPGNPATPFFRGALLTGTFVNGIVTDGIRFTARATTFRLLTGVTPSYFYFGALDDLSGLNPTLYMPLNLTATDQTFEFLLPAAGTYQFSIGALRTNQGPGAIGSYGTTIRLSNLIGFGTPELDPIQSSLPLFFSAVLLLSLKRPRQSVG